ncbi:DUF962 domain-containing protein [Sphingobacterium paludis]|uniref:Membrane protein YGL010W n=1 Tax=Sphingobacterium paludis TaxID=1476465 RepID=A0A4V3E2J3_9SPHI|nr:hypothetical protein [Sphingobacterium paludis]TDS17378.1 hypothetical protein B0I21_101243 [Sphingobacterium paludis]
MKKRDKEKSPTPTFDRPVDRHFYEMDRQFTQVNKGAYALALGMAFFGALGLVWMIPFPQLAFLQKLNMQTFLNWGSFYIAVLIYLYLRLAPTLSYAMLFTIGIMSFFIVQLEYVERAGGLSVWFVSLLSLSIGVVGSYLLARKEAGALSPQVFWRLLTLGPIWLWSKVFKKLTIKY